MSDIDAVRAYRDAWLRSQSLHGHAVVAAADAAIAALEDKLAVAEALAAERTEHRNIALSRLVVTRVELAELKAENEALRREATDLLDAVYQTAMPEEGDRIVREAFCYSEPAWVEAWMREHPTQAEADDYKEEKA